MPVQIAVVTRETDEFEYDQLDLAMRETWCINFGCVNETPRERRLLSHKHHYVRAAVHCSLVRTYPMTGTLQHFLAHC